MSLVQEFATGYYTVRRYGAGSYVNGFYQAGTVEELSIQGSLQPTRGKDTLVLPEGFRFRQSFNFYSDDALTTASQVGLKLADRVLVDGVPFVVMTSEKWQGVDLPYSKAILVRENLEEDLD